MKQELPKKPIKQEVRQEELVPVQNTQPVAEPVKEPEKAPDTELDRLAKILARANPEASEETIRREAAAMVTNIPA